MSKRTLNVYSWAGVEVITTEFYDFLNPECGVVLLGQFEVDVPEFEQRSFGKISEAAKAAWALSQQGRPSRVRKTNDKWQVIDEGN